MLFAVISSFFNQLCICCGAFFALFDIHLQAEYQSLSIHTNVAQQLRDAITSTPEFHRLIEAEQVPSPCASPAVSLSRQTLLDPASDATDRQVIEEYIEECIGKKQSLLKVLRLLCLLSLTGGALPL